MRFRRDGSVTLGVFMPLLRTSVSLVSVRGQTPFGVFQNVLPRERECPWYVSIHIGQWRIGFHEAISE